MKKCKCGSYAVNIERLTGEKCDVCHYKSQVEALRAENAKLIAERDESNKVFGASDRKLLDRLLSERDEAQSDNERLEDKLQEQMNLVGSLLVEREQWMKQDPIGHKVTNTENGSEWIAHIIDPEKFLKNYPELTLTPLYAHPLPSQQVPEELREALELAVVLLHDDLSFGKSDVIKNWISAAPQPGDKP